MKLPNGDRAYVDPRKLYDYSLNRDHEDGQHKALLFERVLGIGTENADELIRSLLQAAAGGDAVMGRSDKYGQRYIVDTPFVGPNGLATIRSVWIIDSGDTVPRLVTCYIL
jgi:hypothetical protein